MTATVRGIDAQGYFESSLMNDAAAGPLMTTS
jgi:hypothetical protein